jgi:hypothetical protein
MVIQGEREMKREGWDKAHGFIKSENNYCIYCAHAEIDTECWYYCNKMEKDGVTKDESMVSATDTCDEFERD